MFDWNDLRYFLELHRSGRLLTTAKRLGTTHATVARHIESIERDLGTQLFAQHTGGYQLTPAGQALLKHAEAMENTALLAQEEMSQAISPLGQIRIGVTEGLGTMFLAPRMGELMQRYPGLEVELVSVPRFVSITNREADIAITLERPSADLLISRLLTRYRLSLFASPAYLESAPPCATAMTCASTRGSATSTTCCSARNCCSTTASAATRRWSSAAPAWLPSNKPPRRASASPSFRSTWACTTRGWCRYCRRSSSNVNTGCARGASCTGRCG